MRNDDPPAKAGASRTDTPYPTWDHFPPCFTARLRLGNLEQSRLSMAKAEYLTAPLKTDKMPPGVPFIVGNEAAERFSYYGMNSILVIFMTKYLMDRQGHLAVMSPAEAEGWYHTFVSCLYFLPIVGAFLADA